MKKAFLVLATLVLLSSAFAQTKFPLTINCSEDGADVYVNSKLYTKTAPNLKIQLPPGQWTIMISKAGFSDYQVLVNHRAPGTVLNIALKSLQAPAQVQPAQTMIPSFPLNVTSNVGGAQVYLNGKLVGSAPFGGRVVGGDYEIKVSAPGYADFVRRISIRGPATVDAQLQGTSQTLSVTSNIRGAEVVINGNVAGQAPFQAQLPQGSYSILVRAPGYVDFGQNVVVSDGPLQVDANLQPLSYQVSVDANVRGAAVFVNGQQSGQTPFVAILFPGSYSIVVRAPGYLDYPVQLDVNGPQVVKATLQPAMATWQLRVPDGLFNKDIKPGRPREIQVWIDGVLQAETSGSVVAGGQVPAGKHVLRMAAGGISVETQFEAVPGKSYTFEPFVGINIK